MSEKRERRTKSSKSSRPLKKKRPASSDLLLECEKCKHPMRVKLKVVSSEITNVITNVISNDVTGVTGNIMEEKKDSADMKNKPPVFPLQVKVEHQGFWVTVNNKHVATTDPLCSRNSVMLQPTCLLSLWKLAFRHSLISKGFLTVDDLDAANLVPHIRVRKDPSDGFSHYEDVKRTYLLSREHFSSRKDFLTIELDIKKNLHFTLVYSKGIGGKMNLLSAFEETITPFSIMTQIWWIDTRVFPTLEKKLLLIGNLPRTSILQILFLQPISKFHRRKNLLFVPKFLLLEQSCSNIQCINTFVC